MSKETNNYINIALISGSGIIAGIMNYLYHPVMLRFLSLKEFGEFASLMGIFNILGVFVLGGILFLNKEVSKAKDKAEKIYSLFIFSIKKLFLLGCCLYGGYILIAPLIAKFLDIHLSLTILAGLSIIFACIGVSTDAVLRGVKSFKFIAINSIFSAFIKLCLGTSLVWFGWKSYGAIGGVLGSSLIISFTTILYVFYLFRNTQTKDISSEIQRDIKKQGFEISQFVLVSFFFSFLMNIDIILAKNIFDENTVGIYAGVSVLGKFLVFLLMSIETVYYSQIMEQKKEKVPSYHISNPLILIALTSIGALIFNYFFGEYLLSILKPELAGNLNLYLLVLVYYTCIAYISFLSKVLVGWGVYKTNIILFIGCSALLFLIYTIPSGNLFGFIYTFIGVGILIISLLIHVFYKERSSHKK